MSVIVARHIPFCSGSGPTPDVFDCGIPATPFCVTIPPASTVTVDTLPTIYYKGSKWLVNIADDPSTRVISYEIYGINRNGVAASYVTHSIVGQTIPHTPNVVISGADMELTITNNDIAPIDVCITRIPIPTAAGYAFIQASTITSYVPVVGLSAIVDGGDSVIADTVRYPREKSVKWLVTISYGALIKSFEVFATFRNGTFIAHTVYGILADVIGVAVDVVQAGNTASLSFTNTEPNPAAIDVTRIPIAFDIPITTICKPGTEGGDVLYVVPTNDVLVPVSTTVDIDSPFFYDHLSVKWLVSITDTITGETMGVQVFATHRNGTLPAHTTYSIIGDLLGVVINVAIVGTDIVLQATNNSVNDVLIDVTRIPVSV